jgi:hypothetical protein
MKSAITAALAALAVLLSVSAFCAENQAMRGSEGYLVLFLVEALYFFCAIAAFILLGKAARLGKLGKGDDVAFDAFDALATLATLATLAALVAAFATALAAAFATALAAALAAALAFVTSSSFYRTAQVFLGISMVCMVVATYQAVVL